MTWQNEIVQDKRELLTLIGAVATSQHVSAEAVNAGGAGYVVGDFVTIPHASAFGVASFEVLTVGGGGAVTSVKRRNWGAYAPRVATVAVNVGGTGYATGEIVEIQGGVGTQMAKARVDGQAGGVVNAVSVFETGGAYSATPGAVGAATLGIGPSTFGGNDDLTLDLTFTGLVGTVGVATAGGTGAGLTLDITLTTTGMRTGSFNAQRDTNDFSLNGVNDEKQLAMAGTVTGGDEPFIQFRTGTAVNGITTVHNLIPGASTGFNPAIDFSSQAGALSSMTGVGESRYAGMFDAQAQDVWISISSRSVTVAIKTQGNVVLTYNWCATGLGNPFATAVNNPYPVAVGGSKQNANDLTDDPILIGGPITAEAKNVNTFPWIVRRDNDGSNQGFRNSFNSGAVLSSDQGVYPCFQGKNLTNGGQPLTVSFDGRKPWFDVIDPQLGTATNVILPTPDTGGDIFLPVPAVLMETVDISAPSGFPDVNNKLRLELENCYWVTGLDSTGTPINAEDTVTDQNGLRYRVIRSGARTEPYSMFCMAEE